MKIGGASNRALRFACENGANERYVLGAARRWNGRDPPLPDKAELGVLRNDAAGIIRPAVVVLTGKNDFDDGYAAGERLTPRLEMDGRGKASNLTLGYERFFGGWRKRDWLGQNFDRKDFNADR